MHRNLQLLLCLCASACISKGGFCCGLIPIPGLDGGLPFIPDGGDFDAGGIDEAVFLQLLGPAAPLFDGGTTTFGAVSVTTTFDGGTRIVSASIGPLVLQTIVYWNGDDTYVTGTGSMSLDGGVDWAYTSYYDAGTQTYVSTILQDLNDDGTFDAQDVWVVNVSSAHPYQKTEIYSQYVDSDGGVAAGDAGTWVQQWSRSGPATADAIGVDDHLALSPLFSWLPSVLVSKLLVGSCNGMDGFPTTNTQTPFSGPTVAVPGTFIRIITDPTVSGFCANEIATALRDAFVISLQDTAGCYTGLNPTNASDIKRAVQTMPLYVACSNSCAGTLASTDLPYDPDGFSLPNFTVNSNGYQRMSINPATVFGQGHGAQWIPEILNHELLHFAGHDHVGLDGNPQGHDMVYGCGRYCTICQSGTATFGWGGQTPTPAQWAWDCTDCAYPSWRFQTYCSGGNVYGKISDVKSCTCEDGMTTGMCETAQSENCFANEAVSGAGRNKFFDGPLAAPNTAYCSGCSTPPGSCCDSNGDGQDFFACSGATGYGSNPCNDWPIGNCSGPNQ